MFKRVVVVAAVLALSAGTAMAQIKGGEIEWSKLTPQDAIAQAQREGMAMFLYFTSKG